MKSLKEYFEKKRKDRQYLEARMSGAKIVDYEMYNHKEKMESLNTTIFLIFVYLAFFILGLFVGASIIVAQAGL